ncbi:heavy-metal-associated domain-containing protein [Thermoproteota archaeon]
MKKTTIKVDGMHCTSCEVLIQDALEDLDGVGDVEVSHAAGTVVVDYDDSMVNAEILKKMISAEGFKVE